MLFPIYSQEANETLLNDLGNGESKGSICKLIVKDDNIDLLRWFENVRLLEFRGRSYDADLAYVSGNEVFEMLFASDLKQQLDNDFSKQKKNLPIIFELAFKYDYFNKVHFNHPYEVCDANADDL